MVSFDFDQAEGLRRMLAGPKPRIVTFLSAASRPEKSAMLVNLGASLANTVNDVLLVDAQSDASGIATRLRAGRGTTLLDVTEKSMDIEMAVQPTEQGFCVSTVGRFAPGGRAAGRDQQRLGEVITALSKKMDVVLLDAELDEDGEVPVVAAASGEIIIQVSADAASIKAGYATVKQLNAKLGKRPYGILVTGAADGEAKRVYANMAQAASRYLAVQLNSVGSVPPDEHVAQAARLGRTVVDAFPLASASVAFRSLAGRFAVPGIGA